MLKAHTCSAVIVVLLGAGALPGQSKPDAGLRIMVVEGEGALNNIREHTARAPVVRVLDAEERAVAGATVNFLLPDFEAGGTFPEGRTHLTTTTDQDGRAGARGLRPNNVAGRFQIRVSASWQGRSASSTISQVNVAPAARSRSSKTKYIIAALAAGGAAGAIFAAKGGSKSTSAAPPGGTTITPGSPVFGPPR